MRTLVGTPGRHTRVPEALDRLHVTQEELRA